MTAGYVWGGPEIASLVMLWPRFPVYPLDSSRFGGSPYGIIPGCCNCVAFLFAEVRFVAGGSNRANGN